MTPRKFDQVGAPAQLERPPEVYCDDCASTDCAGCGYPAWVAVALEVTP